MMVDTGSSDTWVMGSDCKTIACNTHSAFGSSNSDTLQITKTPFHIEYGTGNATGVIVRDTVKLAGLEVSLSFGSASTTSDQFNNYPVDGILGLGRPKGKVMDVQTFLEAVAEKKLLSANLFGVNLDRQVDGNPSGELNFGAPDPTKYAGDLSYTKLVADETNWEIPMDDVIVNGSPCKLTGISAVIDTGTTYMLIPPNDAKILHDKIPGSAVKDPETFMVPCDSKTPLQLVFSKIDYTISPEDYVGKPVAGNGSLCSSNIIGFQAYGEKQWLLGDVFLKNVYSVFDSDDGRIGKCNLLPRHPNQDPNADIWEKALAKRVVPAPLPVQPPSRLHRQHRRLNHPAPYQRPPPQARPPQPSCLPLLNRPLSPLSSSHHTVPLPRRWQRVHRRRPLKSPRKPTRPHPSARAPRRPPAYLRCRQDIWARLRPAPDSHLRDVCCSSWHCRAV